MHTCIQRFLIQYKRNTSLRPRSNTTSSRRHINFNSNRQFIHNRTRRKFPSQLLPTMHRSEYNHVRRLNMPMWQSSFTSHRESYNRQGGH